MYFLDSSLATQMKAADVLVFDMNGLIIDDEPIQLEASNAAFKACGYEAKISKEDWISHCVGHKPAEWILTFLPPSRGSSEEVVRIIKEKDAIYTDIIGTSAKDIVRDGFFELIEFAQKNSKPCAVASSTTKDGVEVILGPRNLDVLSVLSFVICGDQVTKSKPNPEIYLMVKKHFGAHLSYLAFEDASPGVTAAIKAEMACFAVPNTFTRNQDFSLATTVIDSLSPRAKILANHKAVLG